MIKTDKFFTFKFLKERPDKQDISMITFTNAEEA